MSSSSSRSPSPSGSATPAHSTQTKDQEESKVSLAEEVSTETPSRDDEPKPPQHAWQAIFSPQHNAYYFFNAETQETTWVNPLEPTASGSTANTTSSSDPTPTPDASTAEQQEEAQSSSSAPSSSINPATSHYAALQAAAAAQGIDPALAHLDPSLLSSIPGQAVDKSGTVSRCSSPASRRFKVFQMLQDSRSSPPSSTDTQVPSPVLTHGTRLTSRSTNALSACPSFILTSENGSRISRSMGVVSRRALATCMVGLQAAVDKVQQQTGNGRTTGMVGGRGRGRTKRRWKCTRIRRSRRSWRKRRG